MNPRTLPLVRTWLIWLGLLTLGVLLYRAGNSSADAPAVAQPREHKLSSTDMGRVRSIDVHEGDSVQRGQVLAHLDTREVEAQIAVARADLARTEAALPATAVSLESDAFGTHRGLQGEVEQADIELTTLRTAMARDQAELSELQRTLVKERDLVARGLVRGDRAEDLEARRIALEQTVRDAPSRLAAAARRQSAARERLREWDQRYAMQGLQTSAAKSPQSSAAGDARLQPLRVDVEEKRVLLANLEQKLRQAQIIAPADGTVQAILARSGDVVRPGDPLITVIDREPMQVIAYVSERSGVRIEPGTTAVLRRRMALTTASRGETVEGVVNATASAVALLPARFWPNPQVAAWGREVYIQLPPGSGFAPGESVDVRFGGPADPSVRGRIVKAGL
jgi:multidrug resistance efflux pump